MVKSQDQVKAALAEFIKLLESTVDLYAVVLFGSYAKGKPKEFSDIDVAVFSPAFRKDPLEEMTLLLKLRRKVDIDIEPLPFNKEAFLHQARTDFVSEILAHGRLFYKEGKTFF